VAKGMGRWGPSIKNFNANKKIYVKFLVTLTNADCVKETTLHGGFLDLGHP